MAAKTWEVTPYANYNQTMVEQFLNVLVPELKEAIKSQYSDSVMYPTVDDGKWYYTNGRKAPEISAEEAEKQAKIQELRDRAYEEYRLSWDTNEWGNKYRHLSKSATLYFEAYGISGSDADFRNGELRTGDALTWARSWQENSYTYDPFNREMFVSFLAELPPRAKKEVKNYKEGTLLDVEDSEWYFGDGIDAAEGEKLSRIKSLRESAKNSKSFAGSTSQYDSDVQFKHYAQSASAYFEAYALSGDSNDYYDGIDSSENAVVTAARWEYDGYVAYNKSEVVSFLSGLPAKAKKEIKTHVELAAIKVTDAEWYFDVD
ncbi:hypothetical protein FACS189490_04620 [Clostridia bacterium]|nr:hypothetical protein FACS189490_04620 [Clostridia bacterium]